MTKDNNECLQVHNKCVSQCNPDCDFGTLREHILPPISIFPAVLVSFILPLHLHLPCHPCELYPVSPLFPFSVLNFVMFDFGLYVTCVAPQDRKRSKAGSGAASAASSPQDENAFGPLQVSNPLVPLPALAPCV